MSANHYTGDAIRKMTEMFKPRNTAAYNWLMERNFRELAEAAEFIQQGTERSFRWLVDHKHFEIAAFVNAVRGDKKAFKWLMQNNLVFWAATANAANKDKEAMAWLRLHKLIVYAELAEAIIDFDKHDNSDYSGYYKAPV